SFASLSPKAVFERLRSPRRGQLSSIGESVTRRRNTASTANTAYAFARRCSNVSAGFVAPRQWTREELKAYRDQAEALFTERRRDEGPRAYVEVYRELEPLIRKAF